MINTLTKKQVEKIAEYRERGIALGFRTGAIDRSLAEKYTKKLNEFLKRPNGSTIIMHGPLHAWIATCLLSKGQQVEQQVGQQVEQQVWQQVRQQVWQQVRQQVEQQVWQQVRQQVEQQVGQQVRQQVGSFVWPYLDGHWWASYIVWTDYFAEVLKMELPEHSIINDTVSFDLIYPLESGTVVFSDCPQYIHRNASGLHKDGGPSLEYADGTRCWALNGVRVPQELAETKAEALDCKKWIQEQNAEVRREFVRKVGVERLMVKLGSKRLDKEEDYELHEIDLGGRTGAWPALKMLNPSIGIWHVEWVDKACKTVREALTWRNQSDAEPVLLT